jgi:hypothetical protein
MGEAGEAVRALLNLACEKIVGVTSPATACATIPFDLHAGSGQTQDGALDAGPVHGLQPLPSEVLESADNLVVDAAIQVTDRRRPVLLAAWSQEVLFECNLLRHRSDRRNTWREGFDASRLAEFATVGEPLGANPY